MKVLITGATGFVGSHLVPAVLDAGHQVQILVRPNSARKLPKAIRENKNLEVFEGDLTEAGTLDGAGAGCDAVIHLVGIIEEDPDSEITYDKLHVDATRNAIEIARRIGAKRFLHMSALGARDMASSMYHRTKYRAEHLVKTSGLAWVIFRPSLIFGPGDGFINMQKQFVRNKWPMVIPGSGKTLFQPVHISTVVEGFVKALTDDKAIGKVYEVGGPTQVSLNQIIDMIATAKKVTTGPRVHIPLLPLHVVASFMHRIWAGFPINGDQVVMLGENNICDTRAFYSDLGVKTSEFSAKALAAYI